jgi:hypothetical protein
MLEGVPGEYEGYHLTCLPSPHDPRDYQYTRLVAAAGDFQVQVPGPIDYRPNLPPAFNQGQRGSCAASGTIWSIKAFQERTQGDYPESGLSASFAYSLAKTIDGIPGLEGTYPRAIMQVLQKHGVCPEILFPYNLLTDLPAPHVPAVSEAAMAAAERYKIQTYAQICSPGDLDRSNLLATMRQVLLRDGPFVLALLVAENFIPDANGLLPLPQGRIMGGHLVGIVGDLPELGALILRNSWGTGWGLNGYAYLPYKWLTASYDMGYYVFEAWAATDIVVPKAAKKIEIVPWSKQMRVDGQAIELDQPAILTEANRLMVPARAVAGNTGYLTKYENGVAVLTRPI